MRTCCDILENFSFFDFFFSSVRQSLLFLFLFSRCFVFGFIVKYALYLVLSLEMSFGGGIPDVNEPTDIVLSEARKNILILLSNFDTTYIDLSPSVVIKLSTGLRNGIMSNSTMVTLNRYNSAIRTHQLSARGGSQNFLSEHFGTGLIDYRLSDVSHAVIFIRFLVIMAGSRHHSHSIIGEIWDACVDLPKISTVEYFRYILVCPLFAPGSLPFWHDMIRHPFQPVFFP